MGPGTEVWRSLDCRSVTKKILFPVPRMDGRCPQQPPRATPLSVFTSMECKYPITHECIMPEPPLRAGVGGLGGL